MSKEKFSYEQAIQDSTDYFNGDDLAARVFVDKYALRNNNGDILENTPEKMHKRIAKEFARIEKNKFKQPLTESEIFSYLDKFKYIIPQGSPMFGIGNDFQTISLSNCYLLEQPLDSYSSILKIDEQLVSICKRRGGVGIDLDNLRPNGSVTHNAAKTSTGITTWMERYSNSIREVGQCIEENQRVLCKRGLISIKDVKIGDLAWTKDGWVKVLNVFNNGIKDVFKVRTKFGFEVITSKDHVFQTFSDGSLTESKLSDISVKDSVVLSLGDGTQEQNIVLLTGTNYKNINNKPQNCILPTVLDENLAYFLGYSYGDGYIDQTKQGNTGIHLACCNDYPEIKEKLSNISKNIFGYTLLRHKGDGNFENLRMFNKTVVTFLLENSLLKQKAGHLVFPQKLIDSPTSVKCAFLSGYFDADGYASGGKKGYCFSSIDFRFLSEIQKILSTLGIPSKIHKENRSKLGWNDLFSLAIVGKTAQEKFVELFSESCKVSASRFVSRRDCYLTPFKAKSFSIKYNKYNYCPDNSCYMSLSVVNQLKNDGENVNANLISDEVTSIECVGKRNTYDIELEKEHLFWCEGFYVHNSGRRGALMLTLSVHHPDIIEFCAIKNDPTKVTGANISVKLTKEFLDALKNEKYYELRFPVNYKELNIAPKISKTISAKEVWDIITTSAHNRAEPGLLMWDNVIENTPADCYEDFKSKGTNPCSEINLSPLDSCRLLCINLFSYVKNPFTKDAEFDFSLFDQHSQIAQRLMDDLVDLESEKINKIIQKIESDPEPNHVKEDEISTWKKIKYFNDNGRRTGTGITALGDVLAALGIKYGSEESISITEKIYQTLKLSCYRSSVEMSKELGSFINYNAEKEKKCPFIQRIKDEDPSLYKDMVKYGRRNISLITTAPTGSVSCLTQTTSGIEPLFMPFYIRRKKINPNDKNARVDFVDQNGDSWQEFSVYHNKIKLWMDICKQDNWEKSPYYKACAEDINWINRVKMQAAAQKHVCHAISSTINLPEDVSKDVIAKIYETAFDSGCKGITVYRKNCRTGVLIEKKTENKNKIVHTVAPKRPNTLKCDVHHIQMQNKRYYVVVGLLNNDPYEVFVSPNEDDEKDPIIPKTIKDGILVKKAKRKYVLQNSEKEFSCVITNGHSDDNADTVGRLTSASLRHGCPISFIVHQLEKTHGDLSSFSKVLCRVLKKYIPDGTKVSGENCPECSSELVRENGCVSCKSCGHSRCS